MQTYIAAFFLNFSNILENLAPISAASLLTLLMLFRKDIIWLFKTDLQGYGCFFIFYFILFRYLDLFLFILFRYLFLFILFRYLFLFILFCYLLFINILLCISFLNFVILLNSLKGTGKNASCMEQKCENVQISFSKKFAFILEKRQSV